MTVDQTLQQVFRQAVPEAVLVGTACVLFVLGTLKAASRLTAGVVALAGLGLAAALHFAGDPTTGLVTTVTPLLADHMAAFVRLTALATGALLVLSCWNECGDAKAAEYHGCLLTATAGLSLIGAANDLMVLFLALELISIPTYVMLALPRPNDVRSQEAGIKYFMLSILSSAFLLFGFSYLYGLAGTTNLTAMARILPRVVPGDAGTAALIAAMLVLAGLGFRVTAFPFHFYAPDVYQAGPTGTVAFLAFVPKVAGFVALLKIFSFVSEAHPVANDFVKHILLLLWIMAAVTMTAGNVMGLLQNNLRRMLAYSSVANAGYMMIGVAVVPAQAYRENSGGLAAGGGDALLFYLIAYGLMTVGAFAVLAYLDAPARRVETVDDLAGLRETHPRSAFLLAVFFISLIGLPLTAGFAGKFLLFFAALAAPATAPMQDLFRILALVGAVNAAIAAYYYLRVITAMYLRTSLTAPTPLVKNSPLMLTAGFCAIATVAFGVYPGPLLQAARLAIGLPQ